MRMNITRMVESSTHSTGEEEVAGQTVHNVSVAESVVDGFKLQRVKSSQPKERVTVNIISEKNARQNCSRHLSPLQNRMKSATQLLNRRRNDVHPQSTAIITRSTTPNDFHSEKPRRCPLRIAELAEPTKRHCIETWRQRSNILPEFMLDRLKRQVMNQKVVARIPDAVECFKIKPPKKKSPCAQKCVQPGKRHMVGESTIITEARNLSAVFAHHIATRLIKSKVTCPRLTTGRLKILSDVVANEIHELFSKKRNYPEYCYDTTILKEMSIKITMWILGILKDSDEKIMEDQLRAKKYEENRLKDDDSLVTLINTYFQTSKKKSKDLYEEEGPALDAVDSLISHVLNICVPITTIPEHAETISNTSTDGSKSEETSIAGIDADDIFKPKHEDNISDAANVEHKEAFEKIDIHIDQDDVETESKYESIPDDDVDILPRNVDDEDVNINVSDVLVALEESLDEKKKVKFTNLNDPGAGELAGGQGEGGRESNGGWDSSGWGPSGWGQTGYGGTGSIGRSEPGIKYAFQIGKRNEEGFHSFDSPSPRLNKALSEISFRPPNESLLSLADEYWPNDLSYPTLKPSASMSKSITSLAHIQEKEEYYDSQDSESSSIENKANYVNYTSIKETASFNQSITSKTFEIINDMIKTTSINEETNIEDLNEDKNAQRVVEYLSQHPSKEDTACNLDTCYKNAGKGDHLTTTNHSDDRSDSVKSMILKAVKNKFKKPHDDKSKLDYTVYPQNAPLWACSSPSPSNDSRNSNRICKNKMAKCELRRWCVDMEQTVGNLDEWNRWLDLTCKKVLIMKQQSEVDNIFSNEDRSNDLKEWIKLKKGLDKDAMLWRKLTNRTLDVLKNYYDPYAPLIENDILNSVLSKKKLKRQSLMDTLYTIEGLSLWLHRSIVSTENCVKCNCSKLIKKPRTSSESKSGTQPSCSTSIYYDCNRHENL